MHINTRQFVNTILVTVLLFMGGIMPRAIYASGFTVVANNDIPEGEDPLLKIKVKDNTQCGAPTGSVAIEGLDPNKTYEYLLLPKGTVIKPVITLVGDNPITLTVGDTYSDAGATATDLVYGDLSTSIVAHSNVNTAVAGTYTVTYNLSNKEGIAADEVVRTVIVEADIDWTYEGVMTVGYLEDEGNLISGVYQNSNGGTKIGLLAPIWYSFSTHDVFLNCVEFDNTFRLVIVQREILGYGEIDLTQPLTLKIDNTEFTFGPEDSGPDGYSKIINYNPFPAEGQACDIKLKYTLQAPTTYSLIVTNGTVNGTGNYAEGSVVPITANAPAEGYQFKEWIGDTQYLEDPTASTTNVTMPAGNVSLEATYEVIPETVIIGGEEYETVTIGTQTWLKRNLHFDSSGIDGILSYNDDPLNSDEYGYLYTWEAAMEVDGLIEGWHLPSQSEFETLITFLGGESVAGSALKQIGLNGWSSYNEDATNSSGFGGIGGGQFGGVPIPDYHQLGFTGNYQSNTFGLRLKTGAFFPEAGLIQSGYPQDTDASSVRLIKDMPATTYTLTITDGIGSDIFAEGTVVPITANAPAEGQRFKEWTGDTQYLDDPTASTTNVTMPAGDVSVEATYEVIPETVTIGGEEYETVTIGTQTWLKRNLHFDDSSGGIYSYNNDTGISDEYGYLYTWAAAMRVDDLIEGWHLPSNEEFTVLDNYLGGWDVAGGKMKEVGFTHWNSPNSAATNEYGFTALGSGYVYRTGSFLSFNVEGGFCSSTLAEGNSNYYYVRFLSANNDDSWHPLYPVYKDDAYSIRLIKDKPVAYSLSVINGTGTGNYAASEVVEITATTPAEGYQFKEWTGDTQYLADATASTTNLTMPAGNVSVTATYKAIAYSLTVASGTGTGYYSQGTVIPITANAPAEGYQFKEWTGDTQYLEDPTASTTNVTMPTGNVSVEATYEEIKYSLTVTSGTGTGNYAESTVVTITANAPAEGYQFKQWIGDTQYLDDPTASTTNVTMPAGSVNVTATYKAITYILTVTNGTGTGNYSEGTVVPITANAPAQGQQFDQWTGDTQYLADATASTTKVTMPAGNVSVTATFELIPANCMWVAVGSGPSGPSRIIRSTDGIHWTGSGSTIFSSSGYGIASNGSMWVAVGTGTNTIVTSTDGINWSGRGAGVFSSSGYDIAWNGSIWVAVGAGTNTIATSTDGINWTGRGKTVFSSCGYGIAWNGSIWVAVGAGTNTIATSPDGINWTGMGQGLLTSSGYGIAWNGSLWCAVGSGTSHTIATSTDAVIWTGRGKTVFRDYGHGIAWNGSMWVAVGSGNNTISISTDGINWTGRGASILTSYGADVAWNGSMWVAVGNGASNIAISTDGINWTSGETGILNGVQGISSSPAPNLYPPR